MVDLDFSFIRLRDNLEDAHNLGESPNVTDFYLGQVQLLPNDPLSYLQITNSPVDIDFDTIEVFSVELCSGVEEDLSSNFFIGTFTDANGIDQIVFEIANLPTDHHSKLVYFRFELTLAAVTTSFYSNTILITRDRENYTTRFDYRNDSTYEGTDYDNVVWYQSIRLNTYFKEYVSQDELTPYYQISRKQNINQRVNNADINRYIFSFLDGWTAKRLKRMLYGDRVYITRFNDNTGIRNYIIEAFDMPARLERSNIGTGEFLEDPDDTDTRESIQQIIIQNYTFQNETNYEFQNVTNYEI